MNHDEIIHWQIKQLENGENTPMSKDMEAAVKASPTLAQELSTLKQFYGADSFMPAPSSRMKARFYESLAHQSSPKRPEFKFTPWLQAAAVAMVFVLGLLTGRTQAPVEQSASLASLQAEITQLSTVMAVSLLQHDSASQRLVGAAYSKQANMADMGFVNSLLSTLSTEGNTAVKLAVIQALQQEANITLIEQKVIQLTLEERQPLVQMALAQWVMNDASQSSKEWLSDALSTQPLNADVEIFIKNFDLQRRI